MAFQVKDPAKAQRMNIATNLWVARIIPLILAGVVGYATYVLVVVLCINYLLVKHENKSAAIIILVIYFLLFMLMAASFFRLVYITTFDPPLVPLGPSAIQKRKTSSRSGGEKKLRGGIGGGEYDTRDSSGDTSRNVDNPQHDPDSPGLELFYTKDVFVCELDGKPKWCSYCMNWKPDRAHHCSTSGRCIKKMDHFCPWVGGPVGENNMKFFIQFNAYTAIYCLHLLVVMAIYVAKQRSSKVERVSAEMVVILGLACFFFSFTAGMAGSSIHLAMWNLTQVEDLGIKTRIHTLAVIKPSYDRLLQINPRLASQPIYAEITYPLGAGTPPPPGRSHGSGIPSIKANSHLGQWRSSPVAPRLDSAFQPPKTLGSSDPPTAIDSSNAPADFPMVPSAQQNTASQAEAVVGTSMVSSGSPPGTEATSNKENLSERDLKATRTFGILSMPDVGQNPWDLGSALLNMKSVMGDSILDWFLPFRRSPCCNHESTESHYAIGPYVENARKYAGFVEDPANQNTSQNAPMRRRKHRRRRSRSGKEQASLGPNGDVEMDKLKEETPQSGAESGTTGNGEGRS
ncbi:palmitoyltransferase pfa5 [Cadophora gregata]|uniref:palmitoyltransferase pfa5 n=1 Tax=Cadophora gregata TaxID=51156 RepID=UPI0026DBD5FD|nr:palmitoyltransferase pfa5 [Cadophora gregata]KAK0105353.1 palmitoyltransferase pfa5 [Cadophora gregata f. sp. sojae]KAK0105750.1 palmitoyltransferase pfa5 [Cadophora gregata]